MIFHAASTAPVGQGRASAPEPPPAQPTVTPYAPDALDRAQRTLLIAGRPSIAAFARYGARAVR